MSTTYRAFGPFNGLLPQAVQNMVIGFMRDPKTFPFTEYCQYVPAPEIQFMYFKLNPDDPLRLGDVDNYTWARDDYRPTGKAFQLQGEWLNDRTQRWDFPYTLGEDTIRVWKQAGIDVRQLFDDTRASHAALHRAKRVIDGLSTAFTGAQTGDVQSLLGTADPVFFDNSSGTELLSTDTQNPNFQVIKKTFQEVKKRINLATNGVLKGDELIAVMGPKVANAIAASGEIVNAVKQSPLAVQLTDPNIVNWNLPSSYGGFKLVVEDTPLVYVNQNAAGTVADVTVSTQKDYMLNTDTIYFLSRKGGLDGGYGRRQFATVQIYHFGGEARVEAFSEPKHELIEGHIRMDDKVVFPATQAGFALTNVLST